MSPLPTCSTRWEIMYLDKYADALVGAFQPFQPFPIFNLQIWITSIAVVFDPLVQISKFLCIRDPGSWVCQISRTTRTDSAYRVP